MSSLTKPKLILYLALIFLAGGVTGALLSRKSATPSWTRASSMERVCDHMKTRMQSKLGLTAEQMGKIEPILRETARDMESIHKKSMEQLDQILKRSDARVAEILTPEQCVKLQRLEKERLEFMRKRFKAQRTRF